MPECRQFNELKISSVRNVLNFSSTYSLPTYAVGLSFTHTHQNQIKLKLLCYFNVWICVCIRECNEIGGASETNGVCVQLILNARPRPSLCSIRIFHGYQSHVMTEEPTIKAPLFLKKSNTSEFSLLFLVAVVVISFNNIRYGIDKNTTISIQCHSFCALK